ncbi:hypothetical protein B14911_17395 [Bacillus sp. NRRL B-14911]|nr:hypothetical protein B14911_17395 [Bacillus sp. NRRL B-14911]
MGGDFEAEDDPVMWLMRCADEGRELWEAGNLPN